MQILCLKLSQIQVPAYRHRKEFDGEKLGELMDSISRTGLLQPIIVRRAVGDVRRNDVSSWAEREPKSVEPVNYILVAGERRLRALSNLEGTSSGFLFAGEPWELGSVPAVDFGDLDPLAAEEAEYEENAAREDFSWQDRSRAVARLADFRERKARSLGQSLPTVADISLEVRGSSRGSAQETTRQELILARHLDSNPEVAKAKSVKEGFDILKRQEQAERNRELARTVGSTFSASMHTLVKDDCLNWMANSAVADIFDVILTDPPYGINAQSFGDADGRLQSQTHTYDDSPEEWRKLMLACARLWFRVAKAEAHLYVCCDIDRFVELKEILSNEGWNCHRTPIVNYKRDGSRVPWPYWGPQRKWELVLYAMKGKKSVTKIYPDLIETSGDDNLGHGAQKPVSLYTNLLRRSIQPGDRVLDTFAGTGTIFAAAHELKCIATGVEMDESYFGVAARRLEGLR